MNRLVVALGCAVLTACGGGAGSTLAPPTSPPVLPSTSPTASPPVTATATAAAGSPSSRATGPPAASATPVPPGTDPCSLLNADDIQSVLSITVDTGQRSDDAANSDSVCTWDAIDGSGGALVLTYGTLANERDRWAFSCNPGTPQNVGDQACMSTIDNALHVMHHNTQLTLYSAIAASRSTVAQSYVALATRAISRLP